MVSAALAEVPEEPEDAVPDLSPALPEDRYVAAAAGVLAALEDPAAGEGRVDVDSQEVLGELVERWVRTYSPSTGAAYWRDVREWFTYCRRRGHEPLTVGADVVRAYQAQLEAGHGEPEVARKKLGAVRSFYRFVVEDRARPDDPAAGTTRRAPANLAATLSVYGQDRSVAQLAAGFLLAHTSHTRRAYETCLRAWLTWCQEIGLDPMKAERPHIDAYRAVLDERYKPATVNQRMSVIRNFYLYCVEEDALERSPARSAKLHRLPKTTVRTGLDREELRDLLAAAADHDPMTHALFTLLALNGLRISEAVGANVEGLTTIRGHRVLLVMRKGYAGSLQPIPLSPWTARVLDAWLAVRPTRLRPEEGDAETGPIFLNANGVRMTRESAWHRVRSLAKRAVPAKAKTLAPHDLRHTFVTLSLDAGVPLRDVQNSAGHDSAETTMRYDRGRQNLDRNATYTLTAYVSPQDEVGDLQAAREEPAADSAAGEDTAESA